MRKHLVCTIGAATFLTLAACGSREAERAAPEAASIEANATSSVSAANTGTTDRNPSADTAAQRGDRPVQRPANAPPADK